MKNKWSLHLRSATGAAKVHALGNLGIAYADLGEKDKAREYFEQALVIFEAIQSPYVDWAQKRLAELNDV